MAYRSNAILPGMAPLYVSDLRRAIETDNREAMRALLDLMRRNNVGEAYTPGLRELCKQARQILTAELAVTNARNVDERTVAERKWQAPLKPKAEQKACDAGLFSDDSKQTELF